MPRLLFQYSSAKLLRTTIIAYHSPHRLGSIRRAPSLCQRSYLGYPQEAREEQSGDANHDCKCAPERLPRTAAVIRLRGEPQLCSYLNSVCPCGHGYAAAYATIIACGTPTCLVVTARPMTKNPSRPSMPPSMR